MVRKRVDERIRTLIERGVATGQRSMFVLIGDYGKDQVPNLFHIMSRTSVQKTRSKVLWLYKKELGFSSHKKKRMKKLKRDKQRGLLDADNSNADNFELFLTNNEVEFCYYRDSHRVLGSTVGVLVLQDFEALTPNLLARTVECVEGGGIVILLLRTVKSLKQVYTMAMDVHARYRTEGQGDVVPRFNERFILSLSNNANCLVCDDELNVLPGVTSAAVKSLEDKEANLSLIRKGDAGDVIVRNNKEIQELQDLKQSLEDTPHIGSLIALAKTMDQAQAVLTFLDAVSDFSFQSSKTIALTAARGRGKSAALGLCLAGAIHFQFGSIMVTAPEADNLVAVFDFCIRGLTALNYEEHRHYTIFYNTEKAGRESRKCIIGIQVFSGTESTSQQRRQMISYAKPHETGKFSQCEILAIDEAAAIPLPIVRNLTTSSKNRLTFMSSTVNGYEGTGRALALKLIKELRDSSDRQRIDNVKHAGSSIVGAQKKKGEFQVHEQRWKAEASAVTDAVEGGGSLVELALHTPIRYGTGDAVECWLNKLLCLDTSKEDDKLKGGTPSPERCQLYLVNRDALFSYHKKMMSLYSAAHYKNSPNDLQMLSDAPAHKVFVLLSPTAEEDDITLPDILAVVQIALEGKISRKQVEAQLMRGQRSAGDLIPWTISQQYGDSKFAQLSGARVVRVAVHPSVQNMGYGSRAIELIYRYYNGQIFSLNKSLDEDADERIISDDDGEDDANVIAPRKNAPPLLVPLEESRPERLDWIGTSFGLTSQLFNFWSKKLGLKLLYIRQTTNELTGEHSCIMIRSLPRRSGFDDAWLPAFCADARRRIISLLSGPFRRMEVQTVARLLEQSAPNDQYLKEGNEETQAAITKRSGKKTELSEITNDELEFYLTPHDMKRIELYSRNLCDYHLIADLLPILARMYFLGRFGNDTKLSNLQAALLCGLGLQQKSIDDLTNELGSISGGGGLPSNQILAMFHKSIRKMSLKIDAICMNALTSNESKEVVKQLDQMKDVTEKTLAEDAEEGAQEIIKMLTPGSSKEASKKRKAKSSSKKKKKTKN